MYKTEILYLVFWEEFYMKLMHLADLHIGKRVNEFSMIEDQRYILGEIIKIAEEEKVDTVMIAGDIYDKSQPSNEAVELFDDFLVKLSKLGLNIFAISGNHDSPERIAFAGRIMRESKVYMSPVYEGSTEKITIKDSYGNVNFFMLPFIKPAGVRRFFPNEEIESYQDAVDLAIGKMDVDERERNILITHQFVVGSERCESEEISVGGTDSVDAACFSKFDYVALGHLHRPQSCVRDTLRYSGTPLKYSFSEVNDKKSVTIITMEEKGNIKIDTVSLNPLRDMAELKGDFLTLADSALYTEDYVRIILTDKEDILDAVGQLQIIYPNLMRLEYDNERTRKNNEISSPANVKEKSSMELFSEFYELQNNIPLTEEQEEYMRKLIEEMWGEE